MLPLLYYNFTILLFCKQINCIIYHSLWWVLAKICVRMQGHCLQILAKYWILRQNHFLMWQFRLHNTFSQDSQVQILYRRTAAQHLVMTIINYTDKLNKEVISQFYNHLIKDFILFADRVCQCSNLFKSWELTSDNSKLSQNLFSKIYIFRKCCCFINNDILHCCLSRAERWENDSLSKHSKYFQTKNIFQSMRPLTCGTGAAEMNSDI